MNLSCTVSETLSVIFNNLKRLRDCEHIPSDVICYTCISYCTPQCQSAHQRWSAKLNTFHTWRGLKI